MRIYRATVDVWYSSSRGPRDERRSHAIHGQTLEDAQSKLEKLMDRDEDVKRYHEVSFELLAESEA